LYHNCKLQLSNIEKISKYDTPMEMDSRKMTKMHLIFLCVMFSVYACKDNKRKEEATKIVNEWTGKEIRYRELKTKS